MFVLTHQPIKFALTNWLLLLPTHHLTRALPPSLFPLSAVDFFNQINMLYGTITEFCTEESCMIMSAGPKYEYHWADGQTVKKPIKCSAPKYIDYLMTWVQDQLDDETLFPSKIGVPFPKNFLTIAKTILKRLFRVYAHIYHQHFSEVVRLGEEAHLNTSFKHFIFFVQEFNLIDRRELAPLQELIDKLTAKDGRQIWAAAKLTTTTKHL